VASLTASPASVPVRSTVTIRATITKAGGPVAGATVTFTLTKGGSTTTKTLTTDASGVATWKYKAQQKATYSVTVAAASGGATATGGPVTFTAY
jgi:Bacterial Ig-like domain (group 1)